MITTEKIPARVRVTFDDVSDLIDHYGDHPLPFSPTELAFDLRRQLGDDGFELWRELMLTHEPFEPLRKLKGDPRQHASREDWDQFVLRTWASCERKGPTQFDRLLCDEIDRMRGPLLTVEQIAAQAEQEWEEFLEAIAARKALISEHVTRKVGGLE